MSEQKRRQGNSSRTVVIAAVVLLIVVAIAGIVLASRSAPPPAAEVALAPAAAVPASTPATASATTEPIDPNVVVFAAGSEKLPASATVSVGRFAEAARSASGVRMSARFLTGENKARDLALAKARAEAIRKLLEADGIGAEKMQVELVEMPAGSLTEAAANRIDLTLR